MVRERAVRVQEAMHRDPPDVHFEFDNEPEAPRKARQALELLFNDTDDDVAHAVRLTASELVSNVVNHTDGGGMLRAWVPRSEAPLRLEVGDRMDRMPVAESPPGPGGKGLEIVDSVSDAWGIVPVDGGKVVWAEFQRRGPNDGN